MSFEKVLDYFFFVVELLVSKLRLKDLEFLGLMARREKAQDLSKSLRQV